MNTQNLQIGQHVIFNKIHLGSWLKPGHEYIVKSINPFMVLFQDAATYLQTFDDVKGLENSDFNIIN